MNTIFLRLDWYSFLIGAQVSSAIGILCQSVYHGIPLKFNRVYMHPSVHNNGNTFFLMRIKESGNWWDIAPMLYCRLLEKSISGGFSYILMEKFYEGDKAAKSFMCGFGLAVFSCFSYSNGLQHYIPAQTLVCALVSALFAGIFEEFQWLIKKENGVNFNITIPFDILSLSVGATTGYLLGVYFGSYTDQFDSILLPDIEERDSTWEIIRKFCKFIGEILYCLACMYVKIEERFLVSGVLYNFLELIFKQVTGIESPLITTPICGAILGAFYGACSGSPRQIKTSSKLALIIACVARLGWTLSASQGGLTKLIGPFRVLNSPSN